MAFGKTADGDHRHNITKDIEIGREEVKIFLFVDDMRVYISKPKKSTWELLQLNNTLSKVTVYKINSKKSVAFLLTFDKKWSGKEIIEETALTIVKEYKTC